MNVETRIIATVLEFYPDVQAIYLFGTYAACLERPDSDVDIALLLPPLRAKEAGSLMMSPLHEALMALLSRDVDLINLRLAPTVLAKEVIMADRRIFCADEYAADEFEMLTMSFYQRLNEERKDLLETIQRTGRILA